MLANFAAARGVSDMFDFRGHVPRSGEYLGEISCLGEADAPEANPWERDIIEGLAAGRPVIYAVDMTGLWKEPCDRHPITEIRCRNFCCVNETCGQSGASKVDVGSGQTYGGFV